MGIRELLENVDTVNRWDVGHLVFFFLLRWAACAAAFLVIRLVLSLTGLPWWERSW
jgi:hypothetical protein